MRSIPVVLSALLTLSAYGQKHISVAESAAIEGRMVDSESTKRIADSLYSEYQKEPFRFDTENSIGSDDAIVRLINYYTQSAEQNHRCLSCALMRDSLIEISQQEVQRLEEKEYRKVITKADEYFSTQKYPEAKNMYMRAIQFRTTDIYPKQKLYEIDSILFINSFTQSGEQDESENHYQNTILTADYLFDSKNYLSAREHYLIALYWKPESSYPKDKISQIDLILEEKQ